MNYSIFFGNIFIHVAVTALFLTIFFFTIAQFFEKQILEKQINFVIDNFVGNTLKPISTETKANIKKQVNHAFSTIDLSKQDEEVKNSNKKIQEKAWMFVGILVSIIIVIIVIFGIIFKWNKFYIKFLFNSAVTSLIFIAITETLFMFLIAQNYLSADPNQIKLNVVKTLADNRCNKDTPKKECIDI